MSLVAFQLLHNSSDPGPVYIQGYKQTKTGTLKAARQTLQVSLATTNATKCTARVF